MQQFQAILIFYKPYFLWSIGVDLLLLGLSYELIPAVIIKLILILFLWYVISETQHKQKLIFYKNLGISSFKLFSIFFLIDTFITVTFLQFLKEFV